MEKRTEYIQEEKTFDAETIFTVKEISEYFCESDLSTDQTIRLRDDLVGILDNIINSYLKEFK